MEYISKIKALALKSNIKIIKEKFGEEAFHRVIEQLNETDKSIVTAPIISSYQWIPLDTFLNLYEAVAKVLNNGDYSIITEIAGLAAEKELSGIKRVFLAIASVQYVMKGTRIFRSYYNSGKTGVKVIGPGKMVMTVTGFQEKHRLIELHIFGWTKRALEIGGAKFIRAEITKSISEKLGYFEMFGVFET